LGGKSKIFNVSFVTAIEACKSNNDYQWQASALEGYVCAQMVSHLTDMMPDAGDGPIMQLPTSREIIELTANSKKLFAFVCELPERYREILMAHMDIIQFCKSNRVLESLISYPLLFWLGLRDVLPTAPAFLGLMILKA
jgi:hypothetical protein